MSGFDDNPFADPAVDNPFADPSVQQVARSTTNAQQGLDDYNPFDDQTRSQQSTPATAVLSSGGRNEEINPQARQSAQSAIMQAVSPPPPRAAPSGQPPPSFTTADLQRRQEELERKAAELARREAELNTAGGAAGRRNNWPPLPAACPFQPCFYQDINVDIPLEFQRIVRHLYYLWMFHSLVLALNIFGGLAIMIGNGTVSTFGLSFVYFALLTPFSFLCWYRPIYTAFRDDSSLKFMVFFFIFIFQTVITVLQAIGVVDTCGLIVSIRLFSTSVGVGLVTLVVALGFCVAAVGDFLLMIKVHRIYRSSTVISMAKAQDEFTTEFLRNQHVQNAATNAATAAVNSQLNSNRY